MVQGQTDGSSQQLWIDRTPAKRRALTEPIDRVLRNEKLRGLHDWLQLRIEPYVGLFEAGSLAAGDVWVEGRSDRDVLILVDGRLLPKAEGMISAQLVRIGFSDSYLFYLSQKQRFLRTQSDQDISMKFRGVALFGEDLLPQKETPSRAFAERWAAAGLRPMPARFRIRALNGGFWSEQRLRDELYNDLKRMFMFLADKHFAATGHYPRRRTDVADAYRSTGLRELAQSLVAIDLADRRGLIATAELAVGVLQELSPVQASGSPAIKPRVGS
jgi:hypothetical protein